MDKNQLAVGTYNKIAQIYTNQYFLDSSDHHFLDKFSSMLPQNAKVLDVGCGPGQHVKYLSEKGYDVIGIDLSEKMVEIAKNKVPNTKFEVMDMKSLTFDNDTFDGIICMYSLIHIPTLDIVPTLKGFSKVLKPKGKLMILAQKGDPDKITQEPLKINELMFVNFFTQERLKSMLRNSLFEIVLLEEARISDQKAMANSVICVIASKI